MRRLAIFDCDGTLIDSQASICRAMEVAFTEVGQAPPDRAAIRRLVGLSLAEVVHALLPDADAQLRRALVNAYRLAFQRLRADGSIAEPLYEGIADMLAVLAGQGWSLGVATGKSDRGLELALAQHGLGRCFVTLQTADRHPSKPHPAMVDAAIAEANADRDMTVMIGDTGWDMTMAGNAGIRAIGVAWGYHPVAELRATGAAAVALHPRELPGLLAQAERSGMSDST